ncbi:NrsF family protein [Mesorhizobium sp. CAU 1741]|uniref:NrsF family protein n=1 Tax=Mesorhizobium sp. CAU 1741 TaxID=3140366 RepID=UPI00325AB373
METEKLIAALAQDVQPRESGVRAMWLTAGAVGLAAVLLAFVVFVGPRSDIASALETPRFLLKPFITGILFASGFAALFRLMRPGVRLERYALALLAAPAILAAAVLAEMILLPVDLWRDQLVGTNALDCLTVLPLMSAAPLLVFIWALRQGAPTRPVLSGAIAGLSAAGLGGTFYALNCTDDSPFFVMTWYPLATLIVVGAGALLGWKLLRW